MDRNGARLVKFIALLFHCSIALTQTQFLRLLVVVGASRFERPTPCSQGRCATGLRYAPSEPSRLILHSEATISTPMVTVIRILFYIVEEHKYFLNRDQDRCQCSFICISNQVVLRGSAPGSGVCPSMGADRFIPRGPVI